jgi:hypothetical protein
VFEPCTIIIYSSDIRTPVFDIIPSTKITQEKLINLAIRGVEHYEVIERIDEVQTIARQVVSCILS